MVQVQDFRLRLGIQGKKPKVLRFSGCCVSAVWTVSLYRVLRMFKDIRMLTVFILVV
jgi:hypothetical protein